MPMVRAMRLLNAVEAGTTTGAQLQTLLTADPGRLAEFNVLLGMRGQTRRMAASSTAMAAVIASSTAMTAVAASSTAMAAVIASSTAMAAVIASSTAMTAVAASSTAMAAVAASSTAMAAVIASSTAMAAVAASSTAMAAVAASSTAMAAVIASSTAMAAVAASSTAMDALQGSTALPLSSVPAMTSASAPSGRASASSEYAGYPAWYAFNRASGHWDTASQNMTNQWLSYSFPTPRFVHTLELTPGSEGGPTKWRLEYSDDGFTWMTALSVPAYTPVANNKTTHSVAVAGKRAHWRLFAETATSYCSVNEMQLLGFQ